MDGFAHLPKARALFAEDFDLPAKAPEPEAVEPVFSAGDLAAARETAWQDGHAAGQQEASDSDAAATRGAIEQVLGQIAAECDRAALRADQQADAIARLLLDCLRSAFPVLCTGYGDAEVR